MSKAKLIILSIFGAVCIFVCGMGVGQSQNKDLQKENQELQKKYDNLMETYQDLFKEYRDEREANMKVDDEKVLQESYIKAWGDVLYKGKYQYAAIDDKQTTYQVIVNSNYNASEASILIREAGQNTFLFNSFIKPDFVGDTIYLKYLDKSEAELIEFQLIKNDGKFEVKSFAINSDHLEDFAKSLGGN